MSKPALILIGFQNDYFHESGALHAVVKNSIDHAKVLQNSLKLIDAFVPRLIISTPISFSSNYSELGEAVGILKTIQDVKAFQKNTFGAETIDQLKAKGPKILELPGKISFNAFEHTDLEAVLKANDIDEIILAGAVCSVCIDSTGRAAFEKSYKVTMVADCIAGRTVEEQQLYNESIFPIYANVVNHGDLVVE